MAFIHQIKLICDALKQIGCEEELKKDIFNLYDNIITVLKGW